MSERHGSSDAVAPRAGAQQDGEVALPGGAGQHQPLAGHDAQIRAHVRLRGGQTRSLTLPIPLKAWQARETRLEHARPGFHNGEVRG